MKYWRSIAIVAAAIWTGALASSPAFSQPAAPSLLYATAAEWIAADRPSKLSLAQDFMRIYCGEVRMPVDRLIECLDEAADAETKFAQALACSARIASPIVGSDP